MTRISLPRRLAVSLLALTLVGAACGGDDDASDDAATDAAERIEDPLGGTLPGGATLPDDVEDLLEGSLPDEIDEILDDVTIPEDLDDITDLTAPEMPDMPAAGDGSCSVDVTGDITASWTEQQNVGSGLISEWYTDAEREFLGDDFTMLFNCTGDGGNGLTVSTGQDVTGEDVPHAPATYQLSGGGGAFGVVEGDVWHILVTFGASDTNWGIAEEGGTLTVTEFDDDSISFEIDAPLYDSLASMAGTPDQSAHMKVSMTYTRP